MLNMKTVSGEAGGLRPRAVDPASNLMHSPVHGRTFVWLQDFNLLPSFMMRSTLCHTYPQKDFICAPIGSIYSLRKTLKLSCVYWISRQPIVYAALDDTILHSADFRLFQGRSASLATGPADGTVTLVIVVVVSLPHLAQYVHLI